MAIQKNAEEYDDNLGGKWFLQRLKVFLLSRYGEAAVADCFFQIQRMIIRTMESVQKQLLHDKHCFELYGYDVLLDRNLKPWLIEVNGGPSMTANTAEDQALKIGLLDDVFTIVDLQKLLQGTQQQVGGFDLIYTGKPVQQPASCAFLSHLGCKNNRGKNLRKLAITSAIRLGKQLQNRKKGQREKDKQKVRKGRHQVNDE